MKNIMIGALAAAALFASTVPAQAANTYAATKYPIILGHGLWGWSSIAGLDHFYGVGKDLQANGAKVHTTLVSGVNSSDVRGEQFVTQVQKILAVSGAKKVNLISHSQGSQDARYAAAVLPGKIASVTAVHGVVFGSKTIDTIQGADVPLANEMAAALGTLIGLISGGGVLPQDGAAMMDSISSAGSARFNERFPAGVPTTTCGQGAAVVDGTRFYSWMGTSINTNFFDLSDYAFNLLSLPFKGAPSDGVVGKCDAHFGKVIRDDYAMNHLDAVNQIAGAVGKTDPVALFRQHANRLKLAGL